jgi:hypothetical protein
MIERAYRERELVGFVLAVGREGAVDDHLPARGCVTVLRAANARTHRGEDQKRGREGGAGSQAGAFAYPAG